MTPRQQHLADTLRTVGVTLIESSTAFEIYNNFYALSADEAVHKAQIAVNQVQGALQLHWAEDAQRLKGMAK